MTELIATVPKGKGCLWPSRRSWGAVMPMAGTHDHGPGAHKAVSQLSPYIRRRFVLESDVVATALAAHGPDDAEKFVQEVIWRGYFKGWLERRPQVWTSYRQGLEADLAQMDRDRRLRRDVDRAVHGQTGLACFDPHGPTN